MPQWPRLLLLYSHKGLFEIIRENYGELVMISCHCYINVSLKIIKQKEHIAFNSRCRRYKVIPKSLHVKVNTEYGRRIASNTSRQFLTARIEGCYRLVRGFELELFFQERNLSFLMTSKHWSHYVCLPRMTQKIKRNLDRRQSLINCSPTVKKTDCIHQRIDGCWISHHIS